MIICHFICNFYHSFTSLFQYQKSFNKNFSVKMVFIFCIKLFILICPPFGLFLNLLLIWLILAKTPKEMAKHSRILLQTCIFDLFFILQQFIGTALPVQIKDDLFIGIYYGHFAVHIYHLFGPFGLVIFNCISKITYSFDVFLIVFQFVYRYFWLNRNKQISLLRYSILLILPIVLNIIGVSIFLTKYRGGILNCRKEDYEYLNKINMFEESCFIIVDKSLNLFFRYLWTCIIFCMNIFYLIIIILRWRIIRFVKRHHGINENTRRINRQLTKTLTLLAAVPFLSLVFSFVLSFTFILFLIRAEKTMQFQIGTIFLFITPTLNPIISILTNTPYRKAIYRLFFFRKSQQILPMPT